MPGQNYLQSVGEKRRRRKRIVFLGAWFVAIYTLALLFLWLVLRTSVFEVKAIEIFGAKEVPQEVILNLLKNQVVKESWENRFLGVSNILAWPGSFSSAELLLIPSLKSASVERDYSSKKILITVEERTPVGIWCFMKNSPGRCFWFDDSGVLFKPAFSSEGNLIKTVNDYSQEGLGINNKAISEDFLPNLFAILHVLEDSGLSVKEVGIYDLQMEEVQVSTFGGPKIFFSLRFPPEGALEVIDQLKGRAGFNSLSYIDFRVANRAYYK